MLVFVQQLDEQRVGGALVPIEEFLNLRVVAVDLPIPQPLQHVLDGLGHTTAVAVDTYQRQALN